MTGWVVEPFLQRITKIRSKVQNRDFGLIQAGFSYKAAAALEAHLSAHNYLVEERFSVTDIVLAYTLNWGQEQQLLADFPNIDAYMERLLARPHCPLVRHEQA